MFVIFFLGCMVPFAFLFFWYDPLYTMSPNLEEYRIPILCYGIGVFFYASRIPERFSTTGAYDYLGASH